MFGEFWFVIVWKFEIYFISVLAAMFEHAQFCRIIAVWVLIVTVAGKSSIFFFKTSTLLKLSFN